MQGILETLTSRFTHPGEVTWIGVRPEKKADLVALDRVEINENGLVGDHRARPGKRAVSLIQYEHLPVIASLCGHEEVIAADLRRNIVVRGINLLGLRNRRFRIGTAILQGTGLCAPCSRMEAILGEGGYTAMRGHGGIIASVESAGHVAIGDTVESIEDADVSQYQPATEF